MNTNQSKPQYRAVLFNSLKTHSAFGIASSKEAAVMHAAKFLPELFKGSLHFHPVDGTVEHNGRICGSVFQDMSDENTRVSR